MPCCACGLPAAACSCTACSCCSCCSGSHSCAASDPFPSRHRTPPHATAHRQPTRHVTQTRWRECADCQARMSAEGLPDEEHLQSWFVQRIGDSLAERHGRCGGGGAPLQQWRRQPLVAEALNRVLLCVFFVIADTARLLGSSPAAPATAAKPPYWLQPPLPPLGAAALSPLLAHNPATKQS